MYFYNYLLFCSFLSVAAGQTGNWTILSPPNTAPVRGHTDMVFDSLRGESILYGGEANTTVFADTWVWNGSSWLNRFVSSPPGFRSQHSMAFDVLRGEVVLFGGATSWAWGGTRPIDTWVWNGSSWQARATASHPAGRIGASMAYDAKNKNVVLFGGTGDWGSLSDTWVWNGSDWQAMQPAQSPPPRRNHSLVYDPVRQAVILFGGISTGGASPNWYNDTWLWSGTNWTQLVTSSSPAVREGHKLIFDSRLGQVVLQGGATTDTFGTNSYRVLYLDDTWALSATTWTKLTTATSPRPSANHGFTYDSQRQQGVFFAGFGPFTAQTAIWSSPAASSRRVLLLVRDTPDAAVNWFRQMLTTNAVPFTEVRAAQVAATDWRNAVVLAGFAGEPAEFRTAATTIRTAVQNGAWLAVDTFGAYLLQYAGLGRVTGYPWFPVGLDKWMFVKPINDSPIFRGIAAWDPPVAPDKLERYLYSLSQVASLTEYLYTPPPSQAQVIDYWDLTSSPGWHGSSTSSEYCRNWGGCTNNRTVYQAGANGMAAIMMNEGSGRILHFPTLTQLVPGLFDYGPLLGTIFRNFTTWAQESSGPAILISTNPTSLAFGAKAGGSAITPPQEVTVAMTGGSSSWTAVSDSNWLGVTPGTGHGNGKLAVSVVPSAVLPPGTYTGKIIVNATGATNGPLAVNCTLTVKGAATAVPFGSFDTPPDFATGISGSIAVTGWVLDDIGVKLVTIWRDPVGPEPVRPNGYVYIGDAMFVAGARPDVERSFPSTPFAYRAGWGYMMLTYGLPAQGNGTYRIHALAVDEEGNQVRLGTKSITVDNAHSTKPFGAIDTPAPGETVSGTVTVSGWALTPPPCGIATDGSTISVYVNGADRGHPIYSQSRPDVGSIFPGYTNRNFAGGSYSLNSMLYGNGLSTLAWVVTDNCGHVDGMGSRYFNILNATTAASADPAPPIDQTLQLRTARLRRPTAPATSYPAYRHGYDWTATLTPIRQAGDGLLEPIELKELDRLELHLPAGPQWSAALRINDELRDLPIGSTFDPEGAIFYWQLGPGFLGEFILEFRAGDGTVLSIPVRVGTPTAPADAP